MRHIEINGVPPAAAQLYRAATINYGHFTSMQVRDRAVRGLELHMIRLQNATRELFGTDRHERDVREQIKHALRDRSDASVRVTVFAGEGDLSAPSISPDVMVTVTDPVSDAPQQPWSVCTTPYVRDLPHLKHVATMGLIHHWRMAVAAGLDDALFLDSAGFVSEGSAWNVVFWDGSGFVWPQAELLPGITMQLLQTALQGAGIATLQRPVRADELSGFRGALASYSHCPAQPIARIDDVLFSGNAEAAPALRTAWDTVAWEAL